MNLTLYCSVADACAIAGVSRSYMHAMIQDGRIKAEKIGPTYAVLRSSVAKFKRQPGRGRPPAGKTAKGKASRPKR